MKENQTALIELIDKIEQLGQFQDKVEFPASTERIWETFLQDIRSLIDIEGCALFVVEETTMEFHLARAAPAGAQPQFQKELDAQIECGIFPWILKRRQPGLVPGFTLAPGKSVILLPLATTKRTLGMAMVITPIQHGTMTQENMRLLAVLTRQCSLVMENSLLYIGLKTKNESLEKANRQIRYLAQRDALTGCYNRGYMNENLPREVRRALRYRRALTIALCDIDHFKAVNDAHGHHCGDRVLREFVKTVNDYIRTDSDWLARYGGEEFLLVLPETPLDSAACLAERLRKQIAERRFEFQGEAIQVTASFGLVGFDAQQTDEKLAAENLLKQADEYLYQAKKMGRNRVVSGPFSAQSISGETTTPAVPPSDAR
jgi:diguanylate cyclase (GGDEF)-like protein